MDLTTGAGTDEALAGAHTVVDVTNSPAFDSSSSDIFRTATGNLPAAGERAVVTDEGAGVFALVEGHVLTGGPGVRTAPTRYEAWLGDRS
ncbi:hypothetical protein ACFW6F_10160 [Streptomyces sp. NPDC058746]|uniref:hypothetical protein n=1 Tax=Streptomyces sp. NPDC058746 TaxID=3346622 RepID=UPI0036C1CCA5